MNIEKTLGMGVTKDEYKKILAMIAEREKLEGKRISVSQFLRDTFIPLLNGDKPPSVQESKQEPEKNVSPVSKDTISEKQHVLTYDGVNFD